MASTMALSSSLVKKYYTFYICLVFLVVEKYPGLKANENLLKLQDELATTENQILNARNRFNEAVKPCNTHIKTFPNSIFSCLFGFKEKAYFQAVEGAEKPVSVKF